MHKTIEFNCSFLQKPCTNTPWLNPFLTISSRECADKNTMQFLNQLWVVPFCNFSQTCANKRKIGSLLKFITHLAIIYMVGKQMKRVLAQKCYRHILAWKPTPIQTQFNSNNSNKWAFFWVWRCGGFLWKKIFFLSTNFRSFFNCDQFWSAGANKKQLQKRI